MRKHIKHTAKNIDLIVEVARIGSEFQEAIQTAIRNERIHQILQQVKCMCMGLQLVHLRSRACVICYV